jgi:hypothetical protein
VLEESYTDSITELLTLIACNQCPIRFTLKLLFSQVITSINTNKATATNIKQQFYQPLNNGRSEFVLYKILIKKL